MINHNLIIIGTTIKILLGTLTLGFCIALIIFLFCNFNQYGTDDFSVFYLNTQQKLLRSTSNKFLSIALDTSLLRNMEKLPIADERFINLAQHLKPAFIRIGGTSADCLFFQKVCFLYIFINLNE